MIITCENCSKTFSIKDNLIPSEGRLLQCGNCNHKWFFKVSLINIDNEKKIEKFEFKDKSTNTYKEEIIPTEKKEIKNQNSKKIKKGSKIIKNFVVLLISFIALVILIDTFKHQLDIYVPGINSILNNLYETLKDLSLFFKDLIN